MSVSKGRVARLSGMASENDAKYSVTVILCVPGFVMEKSVAQLPASEMIEPAPGIMRAWNDGGLSRKLSWPTFVPTVCVPPPVAVNLTIRLPWTEKTCVTLLPVAVPPSPKSHANVASGSASAAVKPMALPAPASHVLLKVLKVAPVTVKSFDGGGGPPSPIVIISHRFESWNRWWR